MVDITMQLNQKGGFKNMDDQNNLHIGESLYLKVDETEEQAIKSDEKSKQSNVQEREYVAKIVEITDSYIYISLPTNIATQKTAFITDGTPLTAKFARKDQAVYEFLTKVVQRINREVPMLQLLKPSSDHIYRIQRRSFVRVDVTLNAKLTIKNDPSNVTHATIFNISGGGLGMALKHKILDLTVGSHLFVDFQFTLRNGTTVQLRQECEVVRIQEDVVNQRDKIFVSFINMLESDREKIIRYCFEKQLAQRNIRSS